jgi:hypothetical protein
MSSIYLLHLTYNHVPNPKTLNLKGHAHLHAPTYNPNPPKIMDWNPNKIMHWNSPFFPMQAKKFIQKNNIHMYVEMMFITSHLAMVPNITLIGNVQHHCNLRFFYCVHIERFYCMFRVRVQLYSCKGRRWQLYFVIAKDVKS